MYIYFVVYSKLPGSHYFKQIINSSNLTGSLVTCINFVNVQSGQTAKYTIKYRVYMDADMLFLRWHILLSIKTLR